MTEYDELERTWKKAIVAYFEVLSLHFARGGYGKQQKNLTLHLIHRVFIFKRNLSFTP
jgi:hypothetical protein